MNDTIIVAIIGGLSTIIAPIITWFFTSRSKEKEKQYALDSMQKDHAHEIDKIRIQHEHNMKSKEQELEIEIAKLKAATENTKDLDQSSVITEIAGTFIRDEMKNPNSEISKKMKQATKQSTRNFVGGK